MQEQIFWQELRPMEDHARVVLEELQPVGQHHIGAVLWEGPTLEEGKSVRRKVCQRRSVMN